MSLKRAIRKALKELGIETDKISEVVEEVNDIVEEELGSKSKEKDPEPPKSKETNPNSDIEAIKEAHAKELSKVKTAAKLEAKVEAALEKLNIQKGYEDVVRGMIDFDKVQLDDKGALTGLKEQTDALAKERVLLFSVADDKGSEDKKVPEGFEKIDNKLPGGKPGEPDLANDFIAAFTADLPQQNK